MLLKGKHIVLGITGSIAAYKSAVLVRLLVKEGAKVQVVMTPSALEFITPLTLSTLSGNPVVWDFFEKRTGSWHSHVDLGRWADLMLIAPATAATLGKMTSGVADNLLITTYLSCTAPVMVAPAMDLDMFAHPSTQHSLMLLQKWGVKVVEPESGELASHLVGKGRMAEPEHILDAIIAHFTSVQTLSGTRILLTSGPTYENIDPVRFIGNYSSGKMGKALAEESSQRGATVEFVTGPTSILPDIPHIHQVQSARQMLDACESIAPDYDVAIFCAAVADYRIKNTAEDKLKREKSPELTLQLVANPDIARTLGKQKKAHQIHIGFALEVNYDESAAMDKLHRKNFDLIVVNALEDKGAGFGTDSNKVRLLDANGLVQEFPLQSKQEVAQAILDWVEVNHRQ